MHIAPGKTRFVIILDRTVIKIARCRLLHILCFPIALLINKKLRDAWMPKARTHGLWRLVYWKLIQGLEANRREYALFLSSRDSRLAPTHACLWWGLVNVQERGTRVEERELSEEHPFGLWGWHRLFDADIHDARQYARIDGRIRLVDYANPLVSELLRHPLSS